MWFAQVHKVAHRSWSRDRKVWNWHCIACIKAEQAHHGRYNDSTAAQTSCIRESQQEYHEEAGKKLGPEHWENLFVLTDTISNNQVAIQVLF